MDTPPVVEQLVLVAGQDDFLHVGGGAIPDERRRLIDRMQGNRLHQPNE